MKTSTEQIKSFGAIDCVNYWGRTPYSTHEFTDLYLGERKIGFGDYRRINRPWQRFDYEMSMYHAYKSALCNISWSEYERYKADFDALKEFVSD